MTIKNLKLFNYDPHTVIFRGDVVSRDGVMTWSGTTTRVEPWHEDFFLDVELVKHMREYAVSNNEPVFVELADRALNNEGWAASRVDHVMSRMDTTDPLQVIREVGRTHDPRLGARR